MISSYTWSNGLLNHDTKPPAEQCLLIIIPITHQHALVSTSVVDTGAWFNIKMSYQYRKSHCGDTIVIGSSYLHSETSYTGPSGTKFNEILIEIHTFSFKKMHLKMSSVKWQPFCLGLCVKTQWVKGNPRGFWTEAWVWVLTSDSVLTFEIYLELSGSSQYNLVEDEVPVFIDPYLPPSLQRN